MSDAEHVRPSRDGDQFHYHWAARRCLGLLSPDTDLVAVSVEGPAAADGEQIGAGAKSIDVAEYRGSMDPATATHIRYLQLKHSSRRAEREWIASDLSGTFVDFGKRYLALVERFGSADVAARFSFEFVTSRPFASSLESGMQRLRHGREDGLARAAAHAMRLPLDEAAELARLLTLTGQVENFLEQRSMLQTEVTGYLPDRDRDAALHMKNVVVDRATTEFKHRPEITRQDVLKALGVDTRDLFPAPALIELPAAIVPRRQLPALAEDIMAGGSISIISADAGVGKSVLSTQLGSQLPPGSVTLVYDCFGNGAYRSASGYRHRCRDGLVQLANELAGRSLSEPLIPTSKADAADYVRAFLARIRKATEELRSRFADAILCIVIDAADNAQIAAEELHEGPSFPRLLLQEKWPDNVRLVLTARPHRIEMLNPPSSVPLFDLEPFTEEETGDHLRRVFPRASNRDVQEFHRQTSRNPRVQATALAQTTDLPGVLRSLAGEPRTVDALIGELLEKAVSRLLADAPQGERLRIDQVCTALATLRPFVPLDIVARVADVPLALVRSLAHELQRPLIVGEDAIQFRDEPTESWFRQRFRPTGERLNGFISRLLPIATKSAYVAAGLPQLLLEAQRFDELVELALTDKALPAEPAMARRDVALQRLQFALKAAIRAGRSADAAKLALKAGGETAADSRQQKLISLNTDLATHFLEPEQMLEQVSRRLIASTGWTGSEHAYEAAFLSGSPALSGDARSRLRVAIDWLRHWAKLPASARAGSRMARESVSDADIAAIAWAELNLHGTASCAGSLRRWRVRERSYRAGRLLVSRLVDAGRFGDVSELAVAAGNDLGLLLAISSELALVGRLPPREAVERTVRLVASRHVTIREPSGSLGDTEVLEAVTNVVVAAARLRLMPRRRLARTLTRYMRSTYALLGGRSATFKNRRGITLAAYCVRAALRSETITVESLRAAAVRGSAARYEPARKSGRKRQARHLSGGEASLFATEIGTLLPWHVLAAEVRLGRVGRAQLEERIEAARTVSSQADRRSHDEAGSAVSEVAMLWGLLALQSDEPGLLMQRHDTWRRGLKRPLDVPSLIALARHAGRTEGCERTCLGLAQNAFESMSVERMDAQGIADAYVDICRAVLLVSLPEAREYFEQAIEVSGRIGDENLARWQALTDLADAAGRDHVARPELAHRYSRGAELVLAYTENFDWSRALEALVAISPTSGPSVLSRWIDRRVTDENEALPSLVTALRERDALDPRDAICLLPFDGRWSWPSLLRDALRAPASPAERSKVFHNFARYARHRHLRPKEWLGIADLLEKAGVDPAEARNLAAATEGRRHEEGTGRKQREGGSRQEPERDWDAIFAEGVTETAHVAEAYRRFRSGEPPWSPHLFHREAIARVRPGSEAAFIDAVDLAAFSTTYDARELFRVLPREWASSAAVRRAISHLLQNLARREACSITTSRSYEPLPWEDVARFGVAKETVFSEAVTAMGNTSLPVGHDDLFNLAGLLSTMITPSEAADALGYGLELIEPHLLDGDDGPWSAWAEPPATMPEALAGYLWGALASPWAERRWRAAHVVRSFCALGRVEVLDHLAARAAGGLPGPFSAPALFFYSLHARLWLILALVRAADEHPASVKPFLPVLQACAERENPHVLLRELAARAVLSLAASGEGALDQHRVEKLKAINATPLAPGSRRLEGRRGAALEKARAYLFGHDFSRNWLSSFADCFDAARGEIETDVSETMRELWGAEEDGSRIRDRRATLDQFRDQFSHHLPTHWPHVDDLSFYQSVHGLMISSGRLLERLPLAASIYEADPFSAWLRRHTPSLGSGLWLADRRDDKPSALWLTLPEASRPIDDAEVLRLVKAPGGFVLSADWESHQQWTRQRVDVNCVLVSAERSDDLARALQSAADHRDYRLPTTEEDPDAIELEDWSVEGLLRGHDDERRLDRHDPWAAGLQAGIPVPGDHMCSVLGVAGDRSERSWRDERGTIQLRAEVWSDGEENARDTIHDRGRRLVATQAALELLMSRTKRHLLFEVRLRVDRVETRFTRLTDTEKFDEISVTRLLLLRPGHEL